MSDTLGERFDVQREFERTMALVRAPWWLQLLHRPAKTLIGAAALRMHMLGRFALQVRAHTFFQEEMLVALPEESACQLFRDGIIEEDVTSFLLSHLGKGMAFIDVGANLGYFTLRPASGMTD